jgi:CheY-like chemotaxis protein
MPGGEFTLLLVEDNPDHAELVLRHLEGCPVRHRVVHLADGEATLAYLTRRPPFDDPAAAPAPDLILLDLRLPKVDGLDVLRAVKASPDLRAIPVVVLTSSAAEADVVRAYAAHANSYLVKPGDADRLEQMLGDLDRYWIGWNRPPELPVGEREA